MVADVAGELEGELFCEEERAIRGAVEARRREFVTARRCAREALSLLGLPPQALPVGSAGEPCWPPGVVGSITHCSGYRAAVAARAAEFAAVGIDAEPNQRLPAGVLDAVASSRERCALAQADCPEGVCRDRLLFSGKEALFKAWFALSAAKLRFDDASFSIEAPGCFRMTLSGARAAGCSVSGRWRVGNGTLVTAIAIPAAPSGAGFASSECQ